MFTLSIKTANAAFRDDDGLETDNALDGEISRILRELAKRLRTERGEGPICDVNGNTVGRWEYSEE